jgi:hypothetical protein
MTLRTVPLSNTIDQWRTSYNSLATDVGDLSLLGTTRDSNLVVAINELIGEFDSATVQRLARKSVSAGTGIGYDSATGIISLSTPVNTITNAMMADSAIGTAELRNDAVTTIKIADNAITFAKMADSAIGTAELRNNAVTTVKILDNSITFAKMADSAIGPSELRNDAVTTIKIADNAITFAKMADSSVGTAELRNNAVTYQKMQTIATANRILGSTGAGGAVSEVQLQSAMIASGAIDSASLKPAVVTSAKLASAVQLIIYNSAGSALKTLYGAGS